VDHWGVRQLAYPINKRTRATTSSHSSCADPEALPEFERIVKLDDEVLRYLLVLNEGEPTNGAVHHGRSTWSSSVRDDEDDDDDEEEDDDGSPPEFQGGRRPEAPHGGAPILLLNYKDVSTLSRFMTEQGKILPKRTTKVTAAFQRQLGTAVKRARYLRSGALHRRTRADRVERVRASGRRGLGGMAAGRRLFGVTIAASVVQSQRARGRAVPHPGGGSAG
jgi:small subunit ribosomal protein S18